MCNLKMCVNVVACTVYVMSLSRYLLAVVGSVGTTHEVVIGPAVEVRVLPAEEAVTSVARPALTLVHGVAEVAQVDALGRLVAVVGPVLARVLWLAHLVRRGRRRRRRRRRRSRRRRRRRRRMRSVCYKMSRIA